MEISKFQVDCLNVSVEKKISFKAISIYPEGASKCVLFFSFGENPMFTCVISSASGYINIYTRDENGDYLFTDKFKFTSLKSFADFMEGCL